MTDKIPLTRDEVKNYDINIPDQSLLKIYMMRLVKNYILLWKTLFSKQGMNGKDN